MQGWLMRQISIDDAGAEKEGPSQKKAAIGDKRPQATSPAKPKAKFSTPKTPSSAGRQKSLPAPALSKEAQEAIVAVDEASKELPDEAGVNFKFLPEGAGRNEEAEPPNYQKKVAPQGHPEALYGKTFVLSGVLDSLYRETAADLIKKHSGKVTQSVSGRTSFLVVGMDCGRSKYFDAKRHGTKLIDEDGLFSLIRATSHLVQKEPLPIPQPTSAAAPSVARSSSHMGAPSQVSTGSVFTVGTASRGIAAAPPPAGAVEGRAEDRLWVDKHKPRTSADLVGNPGNIKTLRDWLRGWEDVQLRGAEAGTAGTGARPKDLGKKAVLMAGPPGTGKTSTAHIIARECGFQVVEMNASDTRNKADTKVSAGMNGKLANVIKEMCNNRSLSFTATGSFSDRVQRQVLIMDEVDGMSGGDQGGIQDLIETIKKSKLPIICIANDKYSQKLKSLKNCCLELDWYKPSEDQMARRCLNICTEEGLSVNESTLKELCRTSNGDVRLVLGQLQMLRLRTRALTYDQVKGRSGTSKDADMSPFECARRLLDPSFSVQTNKPGSMTTGGRLDLYFADSDLVPLLVQENYLNHRPAIANNNELQRLRAIAKAADSFSLGDVANTNLRRTNNWSLGPAVGVIGTLIPTQYMAGPREIFNLFPNESNFPRFTAWMGNFSHGNKQRRLLGELTTTMASSGHISLHRASVRLDYSSALRTLLTAPLRHHEEEGIPQTLNLMQEYCISKEQMEYILDVTKFKTKALWGEDPYKDVPTKVKSAFTRRFNQEGLVPKCGMMVEDGIKKGKGAKGKAAVKKAKTKSVQEEDEEGEEEDGVAKEREEQQEEEEETEDPDVLEARLKQEGVEFQQAPGKGSSRRGGRGSGGGRVGRGSRRGEQGSGIRGSGRGKK